MSVVTTGGNQMRLLIIVFLIGLSSSARSEEPSNAAYAHKLCDMLSAVSDFSQPCDVSGWDHSVSIWMDATGSQAANYCRQVVWLAGEVGMTFRSNWQLKIFSPYSGENTIAYCQLTPQ